MKHIVIIGNSAAGISCAENIRKKDKSSKITIITHEDYLAYHRCLISYYLAGDIKEDRLIYRAKEFYSENNIELALNKKVTRVDAKKNQVILEDKTRIDYDILVLACGSSPKFPETKGIQKKGVFGFRTVKDASELLGLAPLMPTVCVLGGGLIGLKAAYALKKRKLDVKVIVKSKQLLSQVLDDEAASLFMQQITSHGIEVLTGCEVQEIIGNGDVRAVKLDSGKAIATSIIVVGKGVEPNIGIIKDSGISFEDGILVDDYMRTNIPNIYAAGDVAQAYDPILEKRAVNALWPNAIEQGFCAADNILGENHKYSGSIGMNSVEFFGLPVISFGITRPAPGLGFEELVFKNPSNKIYRKIILQNNIIKGAVFVKRIDNIGVLLKLARLRVDITQIKDKLLRPDFNYTFSESLNYDKEQVYIY